LTAFHVAWLIDLFTLPHKVLGLLSDSELFAITISRFDDERKLIGEAVVNSVGSIGLESFIVEVVLHLGDAVVLSALGANVSRASVRTVDDIVVAHNSTETLVLWFVEVGIWTVLKEGLEASLGPVIWVSSLLSASASNVTIEVGAVILDILHLF